ncbi:MAG: hypothetical protein HKO98_02440, partial [Gemmatimonadetes bacterium]|nr:hypothetical protein [Gemmatimonadota bacterium]
MSEHPGTGLALAAGIALGMAVSPVLGPRAAMGQETPLGLSGGVTTVGQWASDDRARAEVVSSFDLFVDVPLGPFRLFGYGEASTTPRRQGVSRVIGEANTDAGTALDRRRKGRVQLSELRLVLPVAADLETHVGLLDATGFIDVSRIANDENLFFLGVPFVNNPTIEFPDYALGVALSGAVPGTDHLRIGATVTSSHGLADNPTVSYAQLLDVNDDDKGLFAGAALRWRGERSRFSLGAWANSAHHQRLDDPERTKTSRGVFTVLGFFVGEHALSARAGVTNGSVNVSDGSAGLTYLWTRRPDAVGVAVGRSFASDAVPGLDDVVQVEAFLRRRLYREIFVTGSV